MNVQQTIIKGIKEQLFLHSYLVLPNFGGFVLKHKPAHFSISESSLIPAAKTVSFNLQLKQNDGVLAFWLQNELKCTPVESLKHLKEFSDYCSGILSTKRRLTFESIGFFYLDFENNICFEPQTDANFLTDSFGLFPVSVNELLPEPKEIKKENQFVDRVAVPGIKTSAPAKRSNYRFVTPLVLSALFIGFLVLVIGNTTINGRLKSTLFGTSVKSTYNSVHYPQLNLQSYKLENNDYVVDANGVANLSLSENKNVPVKVIESSAVVKEVNSNIIKRLKLDYEIVLGCFTVLSNAKRMVSNLSEKNITADISGKNEKGMHVVSIGNFDSKEQAVQKLVEIKETFPKAWIKKP